MFLRYNLNYEISRKQKIVRVLDKGRKSVIFTSCWSKCYPLFNESILLNFSDAYECSVVCSKVKTVFLNLSFLIPIKVVRKRSRFYRFQNTASHDDLLTKFSLFWPIHSWKSHLETITPCFHFHSSHGLRKTPIIPWNVYNMASMSKQQKELSYFGFQPKIQKSSNSSFSKKISKWRAINKIFWCEKRHKLSHFKDVESPHWKVFRNKGEDLSYLNEICTVCSIDM